MMASSIVFDHLSKTFPGSDGDISALDDICIDLKEQEIACIVGPSGCGKTTLLNIAAGFEAPSAGYCSVEGASVRGPSRDNGFVFQRTALFPWMNVWDNVTIGPKVAHANRKSWEERARHLLEETGLVGFEKHYPYQISGGMAQRVQLVRVLLNQPTVLLMDEPFGALDYQTRLNMHDLLLRLHMEYSPTTLFITHDVEEAVYLADRVIVMSHRPGTVLDDVAIDLPRPRTLALLASAELGQYKTRVLELLGLR